MVSDGHLASRRHRSKSQSDTCPYDFEQSTQSLSVVVSSVKWEKEIYFGGLSQRSKPGQEKALSRVPSGHQLLQNNIWPVSLLWGKASGRFEQMDQWTTPTMIPKVWFLDQQNPCHLKLAGNTNLLNRKVWEQGPAFCISTSPWVILRHTAVGKH